MLKSEQASKAVKSPGRTKQGRPLEILLATLCIFLKQGKEEVSLSEFQESVFEVQKDFSLDYDFFETFLSSLDLLTDLQSLCEEGYVHRYTYCHDTLLPKAFISLTPLGALHAKRIVRNLSPDKVVALDKAVVNAINNYKKRWGLWAR